jgi:hypothetical protein
MDPQTAHAILEGVFTLSGATVIATIIATFIQYGLKPIPVLGLGPWVDLHEQITSLALWAVIVVYAVAALGLPIDLVSAFGYFLAWLGGAKLSGAAYDTAKTVVTAVSKVGSGQ